MKVLDTIMPKFLNRPTLLFIKYLFSAALLAFVLRRLDLAAVFDSLSRLSMETIIIAGVLYLLAHGLNGVKLQMVMAARPVDELIRYTFVALFYGTVLPGQMLGDAVKAYRLVGPGDDSASIVAAVFVDKLTSLAALFLITSFALLIDPRGFPSVFSALSFALLAGLMLAIFLPRFVPWMPDTMDNALGRFLRAWHVSSGGSWSLVSSFLIGLAFQILAVTVVAYVGTGLGISLSFAAWAAVVGLVSLVLLLPVTVAGIGLREGGLVILLGFVGVAPTDAVALSFALLGYTLFGALIGGLADISRR